MEILQQAARHARLVHNAKVMRAAAHTAGVRAMYLQRLLVTQGSPVAPVEIEQQQHAQHTALAEALRHASGSESEETIRRLILGRRARQNHDAGRREDGLGDSHCPGKEVEEA